jgi:hypothetical protein
VAEPVPFVSAESQTYSAERERRARLVRARVSAGLVVFGVTMLLVIAGHAASGALPGAAVPAANPTTGAGSVAVVEPVSPKDAPESQPAPESPPSDHGELVSYLRQGHRLFVDGQVAGTSPTIVHVPCGVHSVHLGSYGTRREIDVPCGGSIEVVP